MKFTYLVILFVLSVSFVVFGFQTYAASEKIEGNEQIDEIQKALAPLKVNLKKALTTAIADSGPMGALDVCKNMAPQIALDASSQTYQLGRSSTKLRNPKNSLELWMAKALNSFEKTTIYTPAKPYLEKVPGGQIRYAEPIYIDTLCLTCHGLSIEPALKAKIKELYPDDQATGYSFGELRGLFWVMDRPNKE